MNSPTLVDFRGNWSPGEQDRVEAAATGAEKADLPAYPDDGTVLWLAVRTVLENKIVYAASRLHVEDGLLARSASNLATRMRRFADQTIDAQETADARPIFQVVYESTASDSLTKTDLQEILRVARSNNAELDITGLLIHAQGHFLQVLEGPEAAVRDLYATIQEDPRHSNIEPLLSTSVAERTFPEWKMALDNLAVVAGEEGVSPLLQTGELETDSTPRGDLMDAIDRFRRAAENE
jgi:hypothetical protein